MSQETVIDCPHCELRVKTETKASFAVESLDPGSDKLYFISQCPSCHSILFGYLGQYIEYDYSIDWKINAKRLWPLPKYIKLSTEIPESAQRDIKDAEKCLSQGIYSATAVLCGRALERLIKEKTGCFKLAKGLKQLKDTEIIDQRLYLWAEALIKERNIGAHASDEQTTQENSQDILDFTVAIFDYVYTLSEKYEKYIARKKDASNFEQLAVIEKSST